MDSATIPIRLRMRADGLCLDFINTRYWRGSPEPTEELNAIADVARWIRAALPELEVALDAAEQAWSGPAGNAALGAALGLREVLHRVLRSQADGAVPDLASLNFALRQALPRERLASRTEGVGWELTAPAIPSVAQLLSPVLWSAADLLTGPRRDRMRACDNPACRFLFLDDSKAGKRRWCSMSACGNRAKARRHYQKMKAARV